MSEEIFGEDKMKDKIIVFDNRKIRRVWHNGDWYFSVVDVVGVLTDSKSPKGYLKNLRRRDIYINEGWGQIATPLKIKTSGGEQNISCANKKGIFMVLFLMFFLVLMINAQDKLQICIEKGIYDGGMENGI